MKPSPRLAAAFLASLLTAGGLAGHLPATAHATDVAHPDVGTRSDDDFETRYEITRWLSADYDLSFADPRVEPGEPPVPIAPTMSMNGGLTAAAGNGLSAACHARLLDDGPGNEGRSITARGSFVMDLLLKYRWWNVEASLFTPGDPFGIRAGVELSF